ncbi:MAG TPA: EamA family transporter [Armatimonadota bacterium]|jgi:drug/metabolite transporter (DMT)-like permease
MFWTVTFALIAALCNSIFSLANRVLMCRDGVGIFAGSFLVQAVSGALALLLIVFFRVPWHPGATWDMLAVVALSLTGFTFMMAAFSRDDASAVAPLIGLKVLFLTVLEACVFGHALGRGVWAGAVVSVVGITLAGQNDTWSLHPRDILRPGVLLMMAGAFFFAASDLFVKRTLHVWGGASLGVSLYLVAMTGVVTALLLLLFSRRLLHAGGWVHAWPALRSALPVLLLCAGTNYLMQLFIFSAFASAGQVTLPNIIYNTRNLFVVLIAAVLVLGAGSRVERLGPRGYAYRTSGALLTLSAIALALLVK